MVEVGKDEFCSKCMEWREFDDQGNCKICGQKIKDLTSKPRVIKDDYDLSDSTPEHDESDVEW